MSPLLKSPRVLGTVAVACFGLGVVLAMLPQGKSRAVDFMPPAEDLCIVPSARIAAALPWDPASGLHIHAARPVPAQARCPVCGMYPSRYPRWAAQLIFEDGAAHFFDSPVDLFIFLEDTARYDPERAGDAVAAHYVTDFDNGHWIAAGEAYFVIGSAARGPMRGADLPAFASRDAAAAFSTANGGEVAAFADITPERVATLRTANHSH
jgi:nitrous oxide reductase accessory protein NosL